MATVLLLGAVVGAAGAADPTTTAPPYDTGLSPCPECAGTGWEITIHPNPGATGERQQTSPESALSGTNASRVLDNGVERESYGAGYSALIAFVRSTFHLAPSLFNSRP